MSLYDELCNTENLKVGWHLTRRGLKDNFIKDPFIATIWGHNLNNNILELRRKLINHKYRFSELLAIEVPKTGISSRPGSTLGLEDAIVLNTIIFLIIEKLNIKLPHNVYSYRLKKDWKQYTTKKSSSIFLEGDAQDIPFLKKSTIYKRYIAYDDWYVSWVEFDEVSKEILLSKQYKYLGVSDISAYFENIHLPLLKSMILEEFPKERKLINLLFEALNFWTISTDEGEKISRGLPQGGSIFSCLGNIYLLPIDNFFIKTGDNIKYCRYMDDIRIFANSEMDINKQLIRLGREIRKLHLNLQSAKTKVLNEQFHEISNEFLDSRLDEINKIDKDIHKYDSLSKEEKLFYSDKIETILLGKNTKRFNVNKKMQNLDLRLFLRYISMSCVLHNDKCINKLFNQLKFNMNLKILRKLPSVCRSFSSHARILEKKIIELMDDYNMFYYQTAIYLESLRYLHKLSNSTFEKVWTILFDRKNNYYVRMQSAYLLISDPQAKNKIIELEQAFFNEENSQVRHAMLFLLLNNNQSSEFIKYLTTVPDEYINMTGNALIKFQEDATSCTQYLNNFLNVENINLFIPFVKIIAKTQNKNIKKILLNRLKNLIT